MSKFYHHLDRTRQLKNDCVVANEPPLHSTFDVGPHIADFNANNTGITKFIAQFLPFSNNSSQS
jgi:hypothetical protein